MNSIETPLVSYERPCGEPLRDQNKKTGKVSCFSNIIFSHQISNSQGLVSWPHTLNIFQMINLNLSGNQIREIPPEIEYASNLTTLDLSHNQLTEIPSRIKHISDLIILNLSHNQLIAFPNVGVTGNRNIGFLPDGELMKKYVSFPHLEFLDISYNALVKLDPSIIRINSIRELYINNNVSLGGFQCILGVSIPNPFDESPRWRYNIFPELTQLNYKNTSLSPPSYTRLRDVALLRGFIEVKGSVFCSKGLENRISAAKITVFFINRMGKELFFKITSFLSLGKIQTLFSSGPLRYHRQEASDVALGALIKLREKKESPFSDIELSTIREIITRETKSHFIDSDDEAKAPRSSAQKVSRFLVHVAF